MLWAEADRMRGLAIDAENLKNQQEVVKNEVRVNVLNQPYSTFPWIDLPMAANENWYNAHNFYGDLEAPRRRDARGRAQRSSGRSTRPTTPSLVVTGDFAADQTKAWIEKYFGGIPTVKLPPPPDLREPRQEKEKRAARTDALATRPALGIAYHLPDRFTPEWYAFGLIDQAIGPGRRLAALRRARAQEGAHRRLSTPASTGASATCSTTAGRCCGWRSSSTTRPRRPTSSCRASTPWSNRVRKQGLDQATLDRARVKMRSNLYANLEQFAGFGRANLLASFALFDDDPSRINRLEDEFAKVTPALVRKTAQEYLRPGNRTVYVIRPGKGTDAGKGERP